MLQMKPRCRQLAVLFGVFWLLALPCAADTVEKSLFLIDEGDVLIAANTLTGQFYRLKLSAKEKPEQRVVGNAVAVLVTNQRFAGVGAWPSGWASLRREAGEILESAEAADNSAVLVTSSRVLSFSGTTGSWSSTDR